MGWQCRLTTPPTEIATPGPAFGNTSIRRTPLKPAVIGRDRGSPAANARWPPRRLPRTTTMTTVR